MFLLEARFLVEKLFTAEKKHTQTHTHRCKTNNPNKNSSSVCSKSKIITYSYIFASQKSNSIQKHWIRPIFMANGDRMISQLKHLFQIFVFCVIKLLCSSKCVIIKPFRRKKKKHSNSVLKKRSRVLITSIFIV